METCVGCGAESARHPIVGIAGKGDVSGTKLAENGDFAAHPVCLLCWRDPAHRKRTLKVHFFQREAMDAALGAAGSDSLSMGPRG